MILYSEHIYLEQRKIAGYITIEKGKITEVSPQKPIGKKIIDYRDYLIIPGYMDIHIHGWGTGGFWSERNVESLVAMKKQLPLTGVTSFLGTTGTDSLERIYTCIDAASTTVVNQNSGDGAELLGVHLEGPFINKKFRGMQKEEYCIDPDLEIMRSFVTRAKQHNLIKFMTIAPELPNAKAVISYCKSQGIQCSIGHSGATFDEIKATKDYGIGGVIHMFSGMQGLHHRELGVAGSAMYFADLYCEFAKQTGQTVRHEAFDIIYRLKGSDRIYLTTDCVALAKMDRKFHHYIRGETFNPLGSGMVEVTKDNGEKYLLNANDYESVKDLELSYEESVRNLVKHTNVTPFDVIKMTSTNPAKFIGVADRKGLLKEGYDADILIVDPTYKIKEVYCMGVPTFLTTKN